MNFQWHKVHARFDDASTLATMPSAAGAFDNGLAVNMPRRRSAHAANCAFTFHDLAAIPTEILKRDLATVPPLSVQTTPILDRWASPIAHPDNIVSLLAATVDG